MSTAQATRLDAHSLLTTAAAAVLGFALNFVAARALGPSGKGSLDLAGTSAGLFTLVLSFSLNAGLTRHLAASSHAPASLTQTIWLWALCSGFVVAGGLFLLPGAASRIGLLPTGDPGLWIAFIAASTMFGLAAGALRGVVIGRGALVTANRIDLTIKLLLLAGYLAAGLVFVSTDASVFALAALPAIALLPVLLNCAQSGPVRPEPGAFRTILIATLPLHGANILHFLNQRADVFFVQAYHGSGEVGLYSLAVSLAQTVLFLSSALAIPLLPQVAASASANTAAEAAAAACRRFVFLGGIGSVALAASAYWVVPAVFGRDFYGSFVPLLLLLPGMIGFGLTNLLVSYFAGTNQNNINLGVSALGLVLTLAGNLTLTRALGAPGAALVSSLAYGAMALAALRLFATRSKVPSWHVILPNRETLRSSVRMLAHLRP